MTSAADPVLYPRELGSAEAYRQDIWRTRQDLAATVGELVDRYTDPVGLLRRAGSRHGRAMIVSGFVLAALVGRRQIVRHPLVASALAGGAILWTQRQRLRADRPSAMPVPPVASSDRDVVDVLCAQHDAIRDAFEWVLDSSDVDDRRERMAALVDMLGKHERAEQELVRPALADLPGADVVTEARRAEEDAADRLMAAAIAGLDSARFPADLQRLRDAVVAHAASEQAEEFPLLRRHLDRDQLGRLASQVNARTQ
ncbi:MAG TPA: hemerythrin domain-containing protein [Micromonosporaceae bacterium]|jgi:hypothetical protein